MQAKLETFYTKEEWLARRSSFIGGSDAACILGANPWKSNQRLWEEKTGRTAPEDLGDNPLVLYGIRAESHLRELFRWDHPELAVFYEEYNMWTNSAVPFAHASLDGWLQDEHGRLGILEIKTATISGAAQKAKWKDGVPQNYYIQLLHYFMVTGFDFAILKAQLKYELPDEELFIHTKHYRIERAEVEQEIEYLKEKEAEFYDHIINDTRPALILPEI